MVIYNPKDWVKLIFQFQRSDTFRQLMPAMIGIGLYTAGLAWLENSYLKTKIEDPTKVHSIVGFVLSMLLVFRINSAYDRWYEGRKLWGAAVNNCRNLGIKLNAMIPPAEKQTREEFRILICNFVYALKEHLRGNFKPEELEASAWIDHEKFKASSHKPNFIAGLLFEKALELYKSGKIDDVQFRILNDELKGLTDITGGCERIKNTPIPYSYSLFLKKIIFLYVFTLPIGYVLVFKYWAVPIAMLVFYAFASIEVISEEIEDPFGYDDNDLDTDGFSSNIKNNLKEILN